MFVVALLDVYFNFSVANWYLAVFLCRRSSLFICFGRGVELMFPVSEGCLNSQKHYIMLGDPWLTFSSCFLSLWTAKGCTLLFYETYGRNSMEQSSLPRYALFAEDSIVQSVPEHPKKENVFCLSNSFGDVYLFQVTGCMHNLVVVSILGCVCESTHISIWWYVHVRTHIMFLPLT